MRASRSSPCRRCSPATGWRTWRPTLRINSPAGRSLCGRRRRSTSCWGQREIGGAYVGADGQLFEGLLQGPGRGAPVAERADPLAVRGKPDGPRLLPARVLRLHPLPGAPAGLCPGAGRAGDPRGAGPSRERPPSRMRMRTSSPTRGEDLYFRTDHHWTQDGAYLAYRAFCEAAGFAPAEDLAAVERRAALLRLALLQGAAVGGSPGIACASTRSRARSR